MLKRAAGFAAAMMLIVTIISPNAFGSSPSPGSGPKSSAAIKLDRSSAEIGGKVRLVGKGFPKNMEGVLTWDADDSELATFETNEKGQIQLIWVVPMVQPGKVTLTAKVDTTEAIAKLKVRLPADIGTPDQATVINPVPTESIEKPATETLTTIEAAPDSPADAATLDNGQVDSVATETPTLVSEDSAENAALPEIPVTELPTTESKGSSESIATAIPTATATSTRTAIPTATSSPTEQVGDFQAAASATGTIYYVDNARGNDNNPGTSTSRAWRSLQKASTAPLKPGDGLLFIRGGLWSGTLTISKSGTSSNRIYVGAYGSGARPAIQFGSNQCIVLSGSYLSVRDLQATDCGQQGIAIRGSRNLVHYVRVVRNATGIIIERNTTGNRVLRSDVLSNTKMIRLTQGGDDDYGAFGILINGDSAEVAYNTISGHDAFSYDYGRDGAAVEVDGGRSARIHHNYASNNDAFVELGGSRAADNTIYYNVVVSSLNSSSFLVTRGGGSWGPVVRTKAHHNTVVLSGKSSQGIYCSPGCGGTGILSLRNNIIQANGTIGYADARFDENYNIFYGGRVQFTMGPNSRIANPQFTSSSNFRLRAASPAIDLGLYLGYPSDYLGNPVPVDGDGNGSRRSDAGAYEYQR